jgi:hypothetical protein
MFEIYLLLSILFQGTSPGPGGISPFAKLVIFVLLTAGHVVAINTTIGNSRNIDWFGLSVLE